MEIALWFKVGIVLTSVGLLLFFSTLRVKSISIGGIFMIVYHALYAVNWCYFLSFLLSCCEFGLIKLAEFFTMMRGKFLCIALQRKSFLVLDLYLDVIYRGFLHGFELFFMIFALIHWLLILVTLLFCLYLLFHEIKDSGFGLWFRLLSIILHLGYRFIHIGISWWMDVVLWSVYTILLRLRFVLLVFRNH